MFLVPVFSFSALAAKISSSVAEKYAKQKRFKKKKEDLVQVLYEPNLPSFLYKYGISVKHVNWFLRINKLAGEYELQPHMLVWIPNKTERDTFTKHPEA